MAAGEFARQVKALTKKNLILLVTRHWLSTLLQSIVAPILVLALTLNIRNFGASRNIYGIGTPTPIRAIQDAIPGSQQLVFVKDPVLGPDIDTVISTVSRQLAPEKVVQFETRDEASSYCVPNFRGTSGCYAIVTFLDSPLTPPFFGMNQTWNYTLRFDPARNSYRANVHYSTNPHQIYHLPAKLAIDNAITNSTEAPEEYMFSSMRQEDLDRILDANYGDTVITTYVIVFFLSVLPGVYHVVGVVSAERASGVAGLIDAMGGGPAVRVVGWIVALGIVQFPVWIVAGCLYWYLLFPQSNAAIPIFWQILSGLAFLNTSIFAASFFRRRIISSLFVCVCITCLGGGAAILLNRAVDTARVIPLSLLFPSMNYIFVLSHMARFALAAWPVFMSEAAIPDPANIASVGQSYFVAVWTFWVLLVVQIFAYPVLAIIAERQLHGINFRDRILSETAGEDRHSGVAIRATGLTKVYTASWLRKALLCGKGRQDHKALDGLDLVAHKNQILCLLGVNGAGKSTALDLLAGSHTPTAGKMVISACSTKLGVCPQKNVLFNRLTILEHVKFWSELKGGKEDLQTLHRLIAACDLTRKMHSRAGTLSGGQKRKLQLACMFVGGATVCLMDEVTSGLDPISRRTIWNIILAERSKRSMVFTTHFLDEGEVLADHIVILSKGQIKCQGTATELKNQLGGGYRVSLPLDTDMSIAGLDAQRTLHQDRIIYRTPDSKSAARLIARLEAAGQSDVQVSGPTIEDVFLGVAQDDIFTSSERASSTPISNNGNDVYDPEKADAAMGIVSLPPLSFAQPTSFAQQLRALLLKRLQILPRYWFAAFLALALPIACMPPINIFISPNFVRPDCLSMSTNNFVNTIPLRMWIAGIRRAPFGPPLANNTLSQVLEDFPIGEEYSMENFSNDWVILDGYDEFREYVDTIPTVFRYYTGGLYMGDREEGGHPPTIAYLSGGRGSSVDLLHLYTAIRSGVRIDTALEEGISVRRVRILDGSWQYILYAAFIFAVYPCLFALYPAFERVTKVKALQISNGVRPLPLWTAYFLFDLCFVLAVSIAFTVTISLQFPFWYEPGYMFPVAFLYGITGILLSYIVSTWATSQLAAFLWTLGFSVLGYFVLALSIMLPAALSDPLDVQRISDIIAFTLSLVFPIGNVFRGMAVGFNLYQLGCRGNRLADAGSWWGYGFPIAYLCLNIVFLTVLLIWLDKDLSFSNLFGRRSSTSSSSNTPENPDATLKHQTPNCDLLQITNLSKSFNSRPAVSSVSLSLSSNEILALLGPNGAGKTTIVNLIRGELRPDSGDILLRGVSLPSNPALAQTSIGVCPQFDALDLLTARQHLRFYARVKGVPAADVAGVMARVGLPDAMADKPASALSGGNKRKLSLAIALLGNPPVLVLDEPSSGMDAAAKRKMWRVLGESVAPGRTILLTTHSMEEADTLATGAAILGGGKVLALGTTQKLRKQYSDFICVQLVLKDGVDERTVEDWVREKFGGEEAGGAVVFDGESLGGLVRFMVPASLSEDEGRKSAVGRLIELLEQNREVLGLEDYSIGAPTLERVFLSVVKDNYVEEEEGRKRGWKRLVSRE
ncbi:ABC transporter domain-containing protein [Madurella fahalii]|uniref:ABC transporter domain-containing protein n=1 Tax=Madurella fahalii TaxID=1157608 RepID=A0ABQ0FX81_9PEZI